MFKQLKITIFSILLFCAAFILSVSFASSEVNVPDINDDMYRFNIEQVSAHGQAFYVLIDKAGNPVSFMRR